MLNAPGVPVYGRALFAIAVVSALLLSMAPALATYGPWAPWKPSPIAGLEFTTKCDPSSGEWLAGVRNLTNRKIIYWWAMTPVGETPDGANGSYAQESIGPGETAKGEWADLWAYPKTPCPGHVSFWMKLDSNFYKKTAPAAGGVRGSLEPTSAPQYNAATAAINRPLVTPPPVKKVGNIRPVSVAQGTPLDRGPAAGVVLAQSLTTLNVKGLDATAAALDFLSTSAPVSDGFANSVVGGGLLVDIVRTFFRPSGNPDNRPPFNEITFQRDAVRADSLIAKYESKVDSTRIALSQHSATSNSVALARPSEAVVEVWRRPAAEKQTPEFADRAIDVYGSQIDRDLARRRGPPVLSIAATKHELAAVAATCSQSKFIRAGLNTRAASPGMGAALFEEMARASAVCAEKARGERKDVFTAWEALFLEDANSDARRVAAQKEFARTRVRLLAVAPSLAKDEHVSAKYRSAGLAAWKKFCDNNSPEEGHDYPDYGRLEPWPAWHADCDGLPKR